jgi:cytoskeletal protein CcmA (bactofilin family)
MWFSRKKQPAIRSLIGEGTVVQGELRFDAGLRVDGEVIGDVIATDPSSLLVISENARVQGKVMAGHVIINGQVQGPVVATTLLELQPKARIIGDVHYEALEMHQGATIDGVMKHVAGSGSEAEAERPLLKLAAANEG